MLPCFLECQPFRVVLDALQDDVTIYDRDSTLIHDLVRQLQVLPWPGNVRELKNLVWQIASENEEEGGEITTAMVSTELAGALAGANGLSVLTSQSVLPFAEHDAGEAQRWRELCQQYGGDVYAIAGVLGFHRTTVLRKLKSYGLIYARKKSSRPRAREMSASPVRGESPVHPNGRH